MQKLKGSRLFKFGLAVANEARQNRIPRVLDGVLLQCPLLAGLSRERYSGRHFGNVYF